MARLRRHGLGRVLSAGGEEGGGVRMRLIPDALADTKEKATTKLAAPPIGSG